MNLLRDLLESMKLVQAITGIGAAGAFVHANTYDDTKGEAIGVCTALSTVLALFSLIVTIIMYVSLALLDHEELCAVEGYLRRYWCSLLAILIATVLSMLLLLASVVFICFQ